MLSFPNGLSYRIKSDGRWLQNQFPKNGQPDWRDCNAAPQGLTIRDIRDAGAYNVECLMSDGRWYEPNGMGGFSLTWSEKQKEDSAKKAAKADAKKGKSDSSSPGNDDDQRKAEEEAERLRQEAEHAEAERIERDLFGDDFKKLDYKDSVKRILESFIQGKPTEEQALDKLQEVSCSAAFYDGIEEWFGKFCEMHKIEPEKIAIPALTDEFVILFPDFRSKYIELKDAFENLKEIAYGDYAIKAGLLDFGAKLKNKQIESTQSDYKSLLYDLHNALSRMRDRMISVEDYVRKLYQYDKKLSKCEEAKDDSNIFGFGGERKRNIKRYKEDIESTLKSVEEDLNELYDNYDKSLSSHKKLVDKAKKLQELTGNEIFASIPALESLEGEGLLTAKIIYSRGKKGINEKIAQAISVPLIAPYIVVDKIIGKKNTCRR